MKASFVAVFSSPVDPGAKGGILAEARQLWPFLRLPREDIHFPYHAHFASHNCRRDHFENQSDYQQAVNDAAALRRDLPEWSRNFPAVTFAVVEADCDGDWVTGGFICRNGAVSCRRELEEQPHADDLLERVQMATAHCDPLAARYFCNMNDLKNEAIGELDVVRRYVALMREKLEEEWNAYDEGARAHLYPGWQDDLEFPCEYLESFHREVDEERTWYQTTLTQELRCSVFVSSYSLLERHLLHICRHLERHRDRVPSLAGKDLASTKGKGIWQARKFLAHVLTYAYFDASKPWREIEQYNTIRNWIVHAGREVMEDEKLAELVQTVAARHDVSIDYGMLELSAGMCDAAAGTMQVLFRDLAGVLPKV